MRPVGTEFPIRFKLEQNGRRFGLELGDVLIKHWHFGAARGSFSLYRVVDIDVKVKIAHCRFIVITLEDMEPDEHIAWELTD